MKIHPAIEKFINLINDSRLKNMESELNQILILLKKNDATQTQASISVHLFFGIGLGESEKIVCTSEIWEKESLQDVAYQTFLYL